MGEAYAGFYPRAIFLKQRETKSTEFNAFMSKHQMFRHKSNKFPTERKLLEKKRRGRGLRGELTSSPKRGKMKKKQCKRTQINHNFW